MKNRNIFLIASLVILIQSLLLVSLFPMGQMDDAQKKQVQILQAASNTGVVIVPESFLRSYDPVTIFFNTPVGPKEGGPLDIPAKIITIKPAHPGEYKWADSQTLQFYPAVPWLPLERYEIKTSNTVKTLVTLMIPPTSVSPSPGSKNMEPIDSFTLNFKDSISISKLKEMIVFEVSPLPGIGSNDIKKLSSKDFTIKEMERSSETSSWVYLVTLNNKITYGMNIKLTLSLSLDASIPGSAAVYNFQTKAQFRAAFMGCQYSVLPVSSTGSTYSPDQAINCGTGRNSLFVEFSEPLYAPDVETVKKFVKFEPAVRNLTYQVNDRWINFYFDADRNKPYKMILKPAEIKSISGRTLSSFGDTWFYFYFSQADSYLKWGQASGIAEQYGPQLFPMEGRATSAVDLRIYKIDPLSRNFWPFPSNPLIINEDARPPMPGEEPAYATDIEKQIRLLGTPHFSRVINLPVSANSLSSRFGINLKPYFAELSGADQPGTYLVGYRIPGSITNRHYIRLTVTDLSLTTIEAEHEINFIVTSLRTGAPISGALVEIETIVDGNFKTILSGQTDSTGQFQYQHKKAVIGQVQRIKITNDKDILTIDPKTPPPYFQNNHWFTSQYGWLAWLGNEPVKQISEARKKGFIATERPIYRPDEPVHIFGYVRVRKEGRILEGDDRLKRQIVIDAPGGKSWSFPVILQSLDNFYFKFDEKDLPTGEYNIYLMEDLSGLTLASASFKKESYRIPEFEINLISAARVPIDKPFDVLLTAEYYAGGRVAGQFVTWKISEYRHHVQPAYYPGFLFSSDERFDKDRWYRSTGVNYQEDYTDDNGSARLFINPASDDMGIPKHYLIEATITGADEQTVSSTIDVYALPAFIIGLKTERFIQEKMEITPEIVVIGHDEKPLEGKSLTLRLYQRQWHSYLTESDFTTGQVKYNSDVVDDLILEKEIISGNGPVKTVLPVKESGVYVIEVLARDNLGRMQRVVSDLYIAGESPVAWRKTTANVFETSTDKSSYEPGDTVSVLLKSPFQQARALAIIEGPVNNEYYWVEINNGQGLFNFTIKEDMTPRIPVHFILNRGRIEGTGAQTSWREDRGKPIAMANTTWINVDPVENLLNLTLEHEKRVLPGSQLKIKIKMSDLRGNPLNGMAALWLVDKAVLALGKERFVNPVYDFIDPVYTHLRISETRNDVIGNLTTEEMPGGSGEDMEDRYGFLDSATVRKNFKTVPYFKDNISIVNGYVEITVDIPDNLTDFAIRAIGFSSFSRFGTAKSVVATRLPLIVQPALPRFVRPGDSFSAGGIGRVVEGDGGPGSVQIKVDGLNIQTVKGALENDFMRVNWEFNKPQQLYFPLSVPVEYEGAGYKEVTVTIGVERDRDNVSDAFALKLPIRPDMPKTTIVTTIPITTDKDSPLPEIREAYRKQTLSRRIRISSEPGVLNIVSGIQYLANYPHGCTEQRISQFYPYTAMTELLKSIGYQNQPERNNTVFNMLAEYLDTCLTSSGLYSPWPGSKGYVYLTAYVVDFLQTAKEAGFSFNAKLLTLPISALKEALRSDYRNFASTYESFIERIDALLALERTGYFDKTYAEEFLASSLSADLYSQARLADLFVKRGFVKEARVQKILKQLKDSLTYKMINGKLTFAGIQENNGSWGGYTLSSEIRTISAVLTALYRSDPANSKYNDLFDYLVSIAGSDGWGSTRDNIAAFNAVSEIIQINSKKNLYDHTVTLSVNNKSVDIKTAGQLLYEYKDSSKNGGYIRYKSGNKKNLPVADIFIEYVPVTTGDKAKAASNGFVIKRDHLVFDDKNKLVNRQSFKSGDVISYPINTIVEEHVEVINPANRYYAAVVVPFAAGFEIMNPALATSSELAKPANMITTQPSYSIYGDDQVTFYYDYLPAGTYHFYFRLRAAFEGSFAQPPAWAEMMYDLDTRGASDGARIKITAK